MEILKEDQGGKNSSKKVAGLIMFFVCISMAYADQFSEHKINSMVWTTFFGGGMVLVGAKWVKELVKK